MKEIAIEIYRIKQSPCKKYKGFIMLKEKFYCASDILICTPALVLVIGALDDI